MLNPSDNSSEQKHRLMFLKHLLRKHPFAFCAGLWISLVFVGAVATLGLFNPGSIEQEASEQTTVLTPVQAPVKKSPATKKPSVPPKSLTTIPQSPANDDLPITTVEQPRAKENLPLSLFSAVALGCAAGSLLLTQVLMHSSQRRHSPTRLKPIGTVRKKRRRSSRRQAPAPKTVQPVNSKLTVQTKGGELVKTENRLTQVTVLPPEESHPLDRTNESLADVMDWRKHHSLTSLMRGK